MDIKWCLCSPYKVFLYFDASIVYLLLFICFYMFFVCCCLVMGQFNHPNVVKLYGIISRVDPVMIVMEYLEKGSLDRHLQVK